MQLNNTAASIAAVLVKKSAIRSQKTLHWQLIKVILSDMCDCNFEAINKVLNKRMEKIRNEIFDD